MKKLEQNNTTLSSWSVIPDDCLLEILCFLSISHIREIILLVNKRFKRICTQDSFLREYLFKRKLDFLYHSCGTVKRGHERLAFVFFYCFIWEIQNIQKNKRFLSEEDFYHPLIKARYQLYIKKDNHHHHHPMKHKKKKSIRQWIEDKKML